MNGSVRAVANGNTTANDASDASSHFNNNTETTLASPAPHLLSTNINNNHTLFTETVLSPDLVLSSEEQHFIRQQETVVPAFMVRMARFANPF